MMETDLILIISKLPGTPVRLYHAPVVDLIGFGKLLRRWAKKSPVRKTGESRAAGKNIRLAPQPARRVV